MKLAEVGIILAQLKNLMVVVMRFSILLTALLVSGCTEVQRAPTGERSVEVYIDEHTGCEYLGLPHRSVPIIPRISSNGVDHKGCGAIQE